MAELNTFEVIQPPTTRELKELMLQGWLGRKAVPLTILSHTQIPRPMPQDVAFVPEGVWQDRSGGATGGFGCGPMVKGEYQGIDLSIDFNVDEDGPATASILV